MKNVIKTISYIAAAAFAVVAIAMVSVSTASAAGIWANGSLGGGQDANASYNECPAAMIGNATTGAGIYTSSAATTTEPCWASSISSVDAGERINVMAKFKNTGNQAITDAKVKISPNGSSSATGQMQFTVTLSGTGVGTVTDTVNVNLSSNQTITFIDYDYYKFSTSSSSYTTSTLGLIDSSIFSSSGKNVGAVAANDYGYIVVAFQVSNNITAPAYNPTVNVTAPNAVTAGSPATISWSTNNDVDYCNFTSSPSNANWNTNNGTSGSDAIVLNQTTTFIATCYAPDGTSVQDQETVTVNSVGGNAPYVNIGASDTSITEGDRVDINWIIDNATSCAYDATPNFSTFDYQSGTSDSELLNLFLSEDTEFTIVCSNQYGTASDSVTVYVNEDNGNGNNNEPDATTDSARDVDEDSAELNGSVDMNDFDNGLVFFVYGQNEDDIDDVDDDFDSYSEVDTDGEDLRKVKVDNDLDGNDGEEEYDKKVTGLDTNETYYFRMCVEYVDEDGDDTLECGNTKEFETDNDYSIDDTDDGGVDPVINPMVVTLPESNLTRTSVILNAGYNANGCENFRTQFFLGTSTNNMNIQTSLVSRGNTSGIMRESISGLSAGTTYYSRAVGYCNGIPVYGDFDQFRTPGNIVFSNPTPTPVTPTVITNTIEAGTGLGCLDLEITNNTDGVSRGQTLVYNVTWKNLCEQDFEDAVINVRLAQELEFLATTRGTYSGKTEHSVIVDLGDIESDEDGEMNITVRVRPAADLGEVIVVEANLGGDGIGNGIQDSAIEFDFDQVYETGFGGLAAAAFGSGFLFGSVWGWLLILLLLAALVLAARFFYVNGKRDERNGYYGYAPAYAHAPAYQQPQYMMHAPQQPMYHVPQAPVYAPAAPMAPAPANLPNMNTMQAAPAAPAAPDYVPYRPAPFDGSQNA